MSRDEYLQSAYSEMGEAEADLKGARMYHLAERVHDIKVQIEENIKWEG